MCLSWNHLKITCFFKTERKDWLVKNWTLLFFFLNHWPRGQSRYHGKTYWLLLLLPAEAFVNTGRLHHDARQVLFRDKMKKKKNEKKKTPEVKKSLVNKCFIESRACLNRTVCIYCTGLENICSNIWVFQHRDEKLNTVVDYTSRISLWRCCDETRKKVMKIFALHFTQTDNHDKLVIQYNTISIITA